MRVVEVITGLGLGGAEQGLVNRLRHQPPGVLTTIINTRPELNHFSAEIQSMVARLVQVHPPLLGRRSLPQIIRDESPDVVVSHLPADSIRILWSRLPRAIPVVVMAESLIMSPRRLPHLVLAAFARPVQSRAALHIAISRQAAEGVQCRGSRASMVIPLGAQLAEAPDTTSPWPSQTKVRLLALSRLADMKNLPKLVHAVADEEEQVRAAHSALAIVGDGPEAGLIAQTIADRGVADIVSLHPSVSPPTAILREADCLMVSSLYEGGPITMFEALLAGTRVTSTPVGLAPETIDATDRECILLPDASRDSLRQGVLASIALGSVPADERRQRSQARQRFGAEALSGQFYQALETLASGRDRSVRSP